MNFSRTDQHRMLIKVDRSVPTSISLEVVKEACGQLTSVFPNHQSLACERMMCGKCRQASMPARSRALKATVNESTHAMACDSTEDSLVSVSDAGKNNEPGLFMPMMVVICCSSVDC